MFESASLAVASGGLDDQKSIVELLLNKLSNLQMILSHVRSTKELVNSNKRLQMLME